MCMSLAHRHASFLALLMLVLSSPTFFSPTFSSRSRWRLSTVSPALGKYTRKPSRSYPTRGLKTCASSLPNWSGSLAKYVISLFGTSFQQFVASSSVVRPSLFLSWSHSKSFSRLQIDRARAVYTHGANFADPRRDPAYWKKWQDFEVRFSPASTPLSLI